MCIPTNFNPLVNETNGCTGCLLPILFFLFEPTGISTGPAVDEISVYIF
jgi:hypothetical protein